MADINHNKKVLIMTVGTGATGADIAHGLFFSIKDSNPNLLVLIGSSKSFETTLPHIKNLIAQEDLHLEILEKLIEEVNDFEFLHFEYSKIINELLRQGHSLYKISVDYTSGTKAMSAALVSAAIETKVGSLSYVYGERGEGGRVKTGTERRSSLSPNKIFSIDAFRKAIEYFNSYRFNDCIELLANFDFHPDYSEKAKLLLQLAKMFDAWDKFDFNIAFEVSKTINADMLKEFNLKGNFEKFYQPSLVKLKSKELSVEKLLDLIANAERRAAEGKYDDAVARLYRALEMLGQIEFEKEFNCSTSDVKTEKLPEYLREDVIKNCEDKKDGKVKIPLFAVFDVLYKIGNEIGSLFNKELEQIKLILTLRNNSILAHGTISLDEKDFIEALKVLKNLTTNFASTVDLPKFPNLK